MTDVFDLRARVSADASPFNNAMDSTAASVSSALSSIGGAASMFIGSGVVRAFARATDAAYEFGQVLADISSISDIGIQQLSKSIKQLDNVYGSMSNVGNSIYNIISSGFDRSEEELLSIVKNVGQASKSIRADLYSTANVFTTVANAYDLSADQFKNIADLLFVTVKEGKAEGNELARTLGLVVNTASEAGLSFAEMAAVISTLSRTQTTSQAMIGFNQMLNAMIKPSKEAADTAAQFGIEFGAAALKSKGFTAIIKDMHDKLQGNVEAINKISGPIRAMRAVVSLTGKQYENFIDILEKAEAQIGTGVAMEAFAKQTNTAKQALENLKVQIDKTFIGVGQDLEPITRYLSEFAEIFLKTFGSGEGLSFGGIGRAGAYISGIGLAIKGVVSSVKLLKNFSTSMVRDGNSLTSSSNTFAANVERAQRALQMSAAAIADINTRMGAVALPNQHLMEQRALHPSPAMIKAQAQANIDAMYLRNSKGALYDPSTGRLVSERKLLTEEIARLTKAYRLEREAIPKQVRRDLAVQRYNRRFGTNYGSYDALRGTGKFLRRWKFLGANVSKGLTMLGTGLLNVGLMVTAWETGWAIGTALREKLKVADWWLTKWIADLSTGNLPGSTDRKKKELEESNLSILKKSLRVRADRLLTAGKLTETEHAAIAHELNLADATEALTRVRNRLANMETPKEEPKPIKTRGQVETENRKIKEEELNKAKEGKYRLDAESEDRLVKIINEYDLPKNAKKQLLEHFSGETWSKELDTSGSVDYRTKLDVVKKYVNSHVYTDDKGNQLDPVLMDRKRDDIILRAHEDFDLLNELYKKAMASYVLELKKWRTDNVKYKKESQIKSAKYRGDLRSYRNTLDNEQNRFESERPETLDTSNYKQSNLSVSILDNEAQNIASAAKLFEDSASNFEDRLTAYNTEVEYLMSMSKIMKDAGISDEDIKVGTARYKQSLDNFKKSLESERKSLIDLAKRHSELPERLSEQTIERAKLLGIDTSSEKFLSDRSRAYEQESINNLGVYAGETALQQELKLKYARVYQELADEAFNELMKSRESVRQNKVSAGIMTESMATRGSIADLQETMKRIKGSIATFARFRMSVPKDSMAYTYYSNRIVDAQGKLADASIKLRGEFNKLSEKSNEVRKGLMNTIQDFTGKDNRLSIDTLTKLGGRWTHGAAGRMSNDALWHSVNLASRMGGMFQSPPYMISTRSLPNRQKAAQMRQKAQSAVSASVDAWIMSQKYAEANVGNTVADIYTFMKQNNTIVVRNK